MPTPLFPTFEKRIKDAVGLLIQQQVTPWFFLNTTNGTKVKYFNGKDISYKGLGFEGSPRQVFWSSGYIEPYLENLCITEISAAVRMANERGVDIKLLLLEVQALLNAGIGYVYSNMAKVDRGLRGKGDPNSAPLQPVDNYIDVMKRFLETHIQAEITMAKSKPKSKFSFEEWIKKNQFWAWLLAGIIVPFGIAIWLSQPKPNITTMQGDIVEGNKTVIGEQFNVNSVLAIADDKANIAIAKLKIGRLFDDFDKDFNTTTENFGRESNRIAEDLSSRGMDRSGGVISLQEALSIKTKRELDSKLINLKRIIQDILVEQLKKPSLEEAGPEFNQYIGQFKMEEAKCREYYKILNDNPKSWEMKTFNQIRLTSSFDVTRH